VIDRYIYIFSNNRYDILDPTLTTLGNQQAKELGKRFESIDIPLKSERGREGRKMNWVSTVGSVH
jgi:broad specificity phosphatase PhoE